MLNSLKSKIESVRKHRHGMGALPSFPKDQGCKVPPPPRPLPGDTFVRGYDPRGQRPGGTIVIPAVYELEQRLSK